MRILHSTYDSIFCWLIQKFHVFQPVKAHARTLGTRILGVHIRQVCNGAGAKKQVDRIRCMNGE